jgi:hypothetical protein
MKQTIPLPLVPRKVRELTGEQPPTYRQVYAAVVNGAVKAEQGSNGRYRVHSDLTPILEHFGLKA